MKNVNLNDQVEANTAAQVETAQAQAGKTAPLTRSDMRMSGTKAGLIGASTALLINLADQAITENWTAQRSACTLGATVLTGGIIGTAHNALGDAYDMIECKPIEGLLAGTWGMTFGILLAQAGNGLTNTIKGMLADDKADTEAFLIENDLMGTEEQAA